MIDCFTPVPPTLRCQSLSIISSISENQDSPFQVSDSLHELSASTNQILVTNSSSHAVTIPPSYQLAISTPVQTDTYVHTKSEIYLTSKQGPLLVKTVRNPSSDLLEDLEFDPDTEPDGLKLPDDCQDNDYRSAILNNRDFPSELKESFLHFLDRVVPGLCSSHEYDFGTLNLNNYKFDIQLKSDTPHTSKPYKLNFVR